MKIKSVADWKLRTKMIFSYLTSMMAVFLILDTALYNVSKEQILEERLGTAKQSVEQYNKTFDEYIHQVDSVTLLPYVDKNLENYLLKTTGRRSYAEYPYDIDAMYRILWDQFLTNKELRYISLASLNGQILSLGKNKRIRAEYAFLENEEYTGYFSSTGELVFSSRHNSRYLFEPYEPVFTVGRRILDFGEGFYSGYILIECSVDVFERVCDQLDNEEEKHIIIADGNGNLLYTSNKHNSWEEEERILALAQANTGMESVWEIDGQTVYSVMDVSELTGWTVYEILPDTSILEVVGPIRNTMFLLSACCIAVVIMCSLLLSGNISHPIRRLQKNMCQIKDGDITMRSDIRNNSEVGQLSQTFNQLLDRIEQLMITNKEMEIKKQEAQFKALKSKIHPHFLYNTLESIRMMAVIDDKNDIADAIEALSDIFRYTIREQADIIDICEELEYTRNYILLQKIRFEDNLEISYDVDEALLHYKIVKFSLQPLVENAILHGRAGSGGKGVLRISIKKREEILEVCVWDNGAEIPPERLSEIRRRLNADEEPGTSLGLTMIQQQIVMYFGKEYGIVLMSEPGEGTNAVIRIPATMEKEWRKHHAVSVSG